MIYMGTSCTNKGFSIPTFDYLRVYGVILCYITRLQLLVMAYGTPNQPARRSAEEGNMGQNMGWDTEPKYQAVDYTTSLGLRSGNETSQYHGVIPFVVGFDQRRVAELAAVISCPTGALLEVEERLLFEHIPALPSIRQPEGSGTPICSCARIG